MRGLLLNKYIIARRGEEFCLQEESGFSSLIGLVVCQAEIQCRKKPWRRHTKKPNIKRSFSEIIDKKGKKGEVNWTEINELERAIENLEDNTDNCSQAFQTPRVLII